MLTGFIESVKEIFSITKSMHFIDRRKGIVLGQTLPSGESTLKAKVTKERVTNETRRHQYHCFRFRQAHHLSYNYRPPLCFCHFDYFYFC